MEKRAFRNAILRLLRKNARITADEIAERLDADAGQVQAAWDEMVSDGTVMGYHTLINEERTDTEEVCAIIEVQVQPERDRGFEHLARLISKFSEVRSVRLVSGRYDLLLEVAGDSLQEVAFFVASKLAPLEGVKSTASHFLLKKYKEAGFILEEDETYERLKVVP